MTIKDFLEDEDFTEDLSSYDFFASYDVDNIWGQWLEHQKWNDDEKSFNAVYERIGYLWNSYFLQGYENVDVDVMVEEQIIQEIQQLS